MAVIVFCIPLVVICYLVFTAKSRVRRYVLAALILLIALWAYRGLRWDPRFDIKTLGGLTPNQVISLLGPPTVDPRNYKPNGWTPAEEMAGDPLKFFYEDGYGWLGQEYAIIFRQDKVAEVKRGTK